MGVMTAVLKNKLCEFLNLGKEVNLIVFIRWSLKLGRSCLNSLPPTPGEPGPIPIRFYPPTSLRRSKTESHPQGTVRPRQTPMFGSGNFIDP